MDASSISLLGTAAGAMTGAGVALWLARAQRRALQAQGDQAAAELQSKGEETLKRIADASVELSDRLQKQVDAMDRQLADALDRLAKTERALAVADECNRTLTQRQQATEGELRAAQYTVTRLTDEVRRLSEKLSESERQRRIREAYWQAENQDLKDQLEILGFPDDPSRTAAKLRECLSAKEEASREVHEEVGRG